LEVKASEAKTTAKCCKENFVKKSFKKKEGKKSSRLKDAKTQFAI